MLEIWRKDAIYTFDFWSGAEVGEPHRLGFRLGDERFTVSYGRSGDRGFESARAVAEGLEARIENGFEPGEYTSSGVVPVDGCAGEAWRCAIDFVDRGFTAEVIGCAVGDGVVVMLEGPDSSCAVAPDEALLEIARSVELAGENKVPAGTGQLLYMLGPVQLAVPQRWEPDSQVRGSLAGAPLSDFANLVLGFTDCETPPPGWLEKPGYTYAFVYDGVSLVKGESMTQRSPEARVTAVSWAAIPPEEPGSRYPPDDVVFEATAVIEWTDGGFTRVSLEQTLQYPDFDRNRDPILLRDLALKIAVSGRRHDRASRES